MSNEAITWAFNQALRSTDKFVLVALADYADEARSCFPSHKKTAARVGSSVATVKRAIDRLEAGGYLFVEARERADGSATSNRYVLNLDRRDPPAHSDPPLQDEPTPVHSYAPTPAHSYDPAPVHGCTTDEPSLIPDLTLTEPGAADADAGEDIVEAEVVEEHPWNVIAQRAYDATDGALPYMGTRGIAKWAIEKKGRAPHEVENAIAALWSAGRAMTKQTVGQVLDGILDPTKRGPQSATERRIERNAKVADEWLAARTGQPAPRNFLEIGQ